jgi:hypothetical protein
MPDPYVASLGQIAIVKNVASAPVLGYHRAAATVRTMIVDGHLLRAASLVPGTIPITSSP